MLNQIILLIIFVILSAVFSAAEVAMTTLSDIKVTALVKQKRKGAHALARLRENPHRMIVTILIYSDTMNVAASSIAALVFIELFGSIGVGIATGIMTFVLIMFGDIVPKTAATHHAVGFSLQMARPIELLGNLVWPLAVFFEVVSKKIILLFGAAKEDPLSEEEIKAIVTLGKEEGLLTSRAAGMMRNLVSFKGVTAGEIMTPKADIQMINGEANLKDVIEFVVKCPYMRYPVYLKSRSNIVGILDESDVLKYAKENKLNVRASSVARPALFVQETTEINKLFSDFESHKIPMGIVVDGHGEVSGLVTIEDILEEIVGNVFITSRNDYIRKLHDKLFRVDGRAPVEHINKALDLGLTETQYFSTIAGFVEHELQRTPKVGERIDLRKAIIEVCEVTPKGVKSVNILKK
jgi:Mg2+/Co2+ transporter CorB